MARIRTAWATLLMIRKVGFSSLERKEWQLRLLTHSVRNIWGLQLNGGPFRFLSSDPFPLR